MATFPMTDTNGTTRIPVRNVWHMSKKLSVWFPDTTENWGRPTLGKPAWIWPVNLKGTVEYISKM